MADLNDILFDNNEQPKDDDLINYIKDNLSEEEKYELEKKTIDSGFVNDALEGLQKFNEKKDLDHYVQQLNKNLEKQLTEKKQRRQKRVLKENPWTIITLILLLTICIIGYYLIHLYFKNKQSAVPAKTEITTKV